MQRLLPLTLLALLLTACGQTGKLYLPDAPPPHKPATEKTTEAH